MVGEAAVTDLAGEAEHTLLSVAVVTDSAVVTHLADSLAEASVGDSAKRKHFLLASAITAALVTVVSVDVIATFAVVVFAILMKTSLIRASMGSDIRIIISTTTRITTDTPISNYGAYLNGRRISGTTERLKPESTRAQAMQFVLCQPRPVMRQVAEFNELFGS